MTDGSFRMPAAFNAIHKAKNDEMGHIVCVNGEDPSQFLASMEIQQSLNDYPNNSDAHSWHTPSISGSIVNVHHNDSNSVDVADLEESNELGEFDFSDSLDGRRSFTSALSRQQQSLKSQQDPVVVYPKQQPEIRGILSNPGDTNVNDATPRSPVPPQLESRDSNISTVGSVSTTNTNSNLYHQRTVSSATTTTTEQPGSTNTGNSSRLKFVNAGRPPLSSDSSCPNSRLLAFSSTASFKTGIDLYGFKKPTYEISTAEFDEFSARYSKYVERREQKWKEFLKASGLSIGTDGNPPVRFPTESQKLRRYVRKGIPPKWRGNAWFWYARGHEKLNAHPGLYEKLVTETMDLKNNDVEHIERDLHRTFPDNIYFRNDPITNEESALLKALRRVLTCFSVYQPKIGYCQSLNFIAGNLLLFIDEERAFWMLVIITQNYLSGLHEVNLEQVNISQGILMINVRDRLPKIWNALSLDQSLEDNFISNLPPISLCTAPWFMSLMVNVLPTETMLRVWDCIFLEGPKTLYRIALTIFKLAEPQLVKATDELEVFQIIQSSPKKLYDPGVLMSACFKRANGFGHISNEDVAMLRAFVQNRRKQALDGTDSGTSDRHAYAKLHRGRRVKAKLSLYR